MSRRIAIVLVVALAAAVGALWWWRERDTPLPIAAATPSPAFYMPTQEELEARPPRQVWVYYEARADELLHREVRTIRQSTLRSAEAKQVILEWLAGPRDPAFVVPSNPLLTLRELYLDGKGTAYVDLAGSLEPAGSHSETAFAYALIETLSANFPEVLRVKILLNGRDAETLAGHLATGQSLRRDPRRVAP